MKGKSHKMKKTVVKTIVLFFLLVILFGCSEMEGGKIKVKTDTEEQYYLYWLMNSGLGEYIDLLISKQPIEQLVSANLHKTESLSDSLAIVVRTYMKDSLWNYDGRPFKSVTSILNIEVEKKTIVINQIKYLYVSAELPDIIKLFEKPEGTIKIHRIYSPFSGAEEFAKELLEQLKKQDNKE